ncbi:hypothetical protein EV143_101556 [Flavobacterium chryseum]|uniref:hypothetical protein n=1 Tax=Flavobacterium sp. P3160 TaxID=2512113 RepID=UPI00105E1BF2|nr:hypothetical protein [Flavobacterium sp. P3160]TDO84111.1 hypothetical protein EV143_101556 [Flavobacterium sp. P3160]
MSFTASIFIPQKPKGFNLTRSEKLCWYSLGALVIYSLPMLFIEKYFDYRFPQWAYYPALLIFLLNFSSYFIRITEFENLNGYFDGTISFEEDFLILNETEYKYSELENLVIYGNSFSGEKTKNYRYGPMYANGVENLISFNHNEFKVEQYFQLNSERHLDKLQETLIHIITTEKIPYNREYLNFINEEHRSFILFELFIGKLIKEKRIEYQDGIQLIGLNSKQAEEFKIKNCLK